MQEFSEVPTKTFAAANMDPPAVSRRLRKIPRNWSTIVLWGVLTVSSLFMIAPFYWMITGGFKTNLEITVIPPTWWPKAPTLDTLVWTWTTLGFARAFRNSLIVTGITTGVVLFTSTLAGYVFEKIEFPGRHVIFVLILSAMMIPFHVVMIPRYLVIVEFHWVNNYLGLIVPAAISPFGVFLMKQFMHSVPNELLDAARVDGASEFGIFFRIVLPLCAAPLAALSIFTFIWTWDALLWPLIVLNDPALYTVPLKLAKLQGEFSREYAAQLAGATIAVVPVLAFYFLASRRFIEGIALTGLKG